MSSLVKMTHALEDTVIKLLLIWISFLVIFEVVLRFVFNTGFIWLQELTLYSSAWFVLLGASWGIRQNSHIGVTFLTNRMDTPQRKFWGMIALLLCLVYCGLFFYGSIIYLKKLYMIGIELEDLPFPKWIAMLALPLGFISITIRVCVIAYQVLQNQSLGFSFHDEAKESNDMITDADDVSGKKDVSS